MVRFKKSIAKCPLILIYNPISKVLEHSSHSTLVSMNISIVIQGSVTFNEKIRMSSYSSKMETAFKNFHFHLMHFGCVCPFILLS